jgi:hypothetical protein
MLFTFSSRCSRLAVPAIARSRSTAVRQYAFRSTADGFYLGKNHGTQSTSMMTATAAALGLTSLCLLISSNHHEVTFLEKSSIPSSGDVISAGTPVKEVATGILFPPLCNGYYLAGTGVRVKWGLIKVYAVGTYVDPLAMSAVKTDEKAIEKALLDPNYPRTIRIVMNRALSIDKYTAAIVEALKPRMNGEDLDKLDEFKALNPPVDLVKGTFT